MTLNTPLRIFRSLVALVSLVVVFAACGTGSEPPKPIAITIGILRGSPASAVMGDTFKAAMSALGYVEGKTIAYLDSGLIKDKGTLLNEAKRLVDAKVNLIYAVGVEAARAAKAVTDGTTMRVIFSPVADPVGQDLLKDLIHPEGNLTGITGGNAYAGRALEYLKKVSPNSKRVLVASGPSTPSSLLTVLTNDAKQLHIELVVKNLNSDQDAGETTVNIPNDVDAIYLISDVHKNSPTPELIKAALARKIPLVSTNTSDVQNGSLLSYGFSSEGVGQQTAVMADKLLKGAVPYSIPTEQPEYFLAVNLKTAQALGLVIPDDILRQGKEIVK